jgi:hypothetical protein
MQDTLKMLGEFPKPSRVGQTDRGTYIVYEFPSKEESEEAFEHFVDNADITITFNRNS